jgi:hypothetical protein
MIDGVDEETVHRACVAMAEYHNAGLLERMEQTTPEMFAQYQIVPYEEWLIFASPGGFTNQLFMVGDGVVYEFPGWESYDDALANARALRSQGGRR